MVILQNVPPAIDYRENIQKRAIQIFFIQKQLYLMSSVGFSARNQ